MVGAVVAEGQADEVGDVRVGDRVDVTSAVLVRVDQTGEFQFGQVTIAVNGFGYGGTNAHTILQEFRQVSRPPAQQARHFGVLPISARSTGAARALAGRFADLITAGADPGRLAEAAWTRMALTSSAPACSSATPPTWSGPPGWVPAARPAASRPPP
ncbi:ketoacyl-synthetase C-terminal extension domain-containing protein [Nocardia beijingensis]|uniref:ketoacyl-synthetase C-terminal extension domain-containing protein n=1 Tax=Nocardia beijingensis TaxID=95162 RepID=UPI002B4ADDA4|nr:ketoacyl-synthetase C-terminal extension domain-containing protein [Nocardia beijingensis]